MTMLAREVAEQLQIWGAGIFATADPTQRTIFVGEIPNDDDDSGAPLYNEALLILIAPSPPPHLYLDTEYPVLDFWARSSHTDRAYARLELVQELLQRRSNWDLPHWHIYLSSALGSIVDVDRDSEGSKLFRLSVQFICRNTDHVS